MITGRTAKIFIAKAGKTPSTISPFSKEPMEIHQNHLQKAIQKAKESSKELYLSRSITDPLFSTKEWKTLIPFIANNPNIEELLLNCKYIDNNLNPIICVDWLMGDESIKILMESLRPIQTLRIRGRLK